MTKLSGKTAAKSLWSVYKKVVLAIFAFELLLLFLWYNDGLGEACKFNGSAMEQCFLLGMNIDELADTFIAPLMIPIIGIFFGLLTPVLAALWPSVILWIVLYVWKYRKGETQAIQPPPTVQRD